MSSNVRSTRPCLLYKLKYGRIEKNVSKEMILRDYNVIVLFIKVSFNVKVTCTNNHEINDC